MLPHQARLRSRAEFTEITRRGLRAGAPALVVHLDSGQAGSVARAGFVVSRAVGPAVTRNRVRRRLRHLVRDRLDRLPAGSRVVVRATPVAATSDSGALGVELDALLSKLVERLPAR